VPAFTADVGEAQLGLSLLAADLTMSVPFHSSLSLTKLSSGARDVPDDLLAGERHCFVAPYPAIPRTPTWKRSLAPSTPEVLRPRTCERRGCQPGPSAMEATDRLGEIIR
jgi:hypothetical protein